MATPVVVSRIQNRRGTQTQFDALYPTYPGTGQEILQPGEIALCTDSRRIFIGNINGEYVELATSTLANLVFQPLVIVLPPAGSFTVIPQLTHLPTPFYNLVYSVTDAPTADQNLVGNSFSRNGEMKITATVPFVPAPPPPGFPPLTPVQLTDSSVEVNTTAFDISFQANYDISNTNIEVSYIHNFPGNLIFSTSSIIWASL